jgi:hypothetical protein
MRLALLFYLYRNLLKEMIGFYKNFRNFQFKLAISGLKKESNRGERN